MRIDSDLGPSHIIEGAFPTSYPSQLFLNSHGVRGISTVELDQRSYRSQA